MRKPDILEQPVLNILLSLTAISVLEPGIPHFGLLDFDRLTTRLARHPRSFSASLWPYRSLTSGF